MIDSLFQDTIFTFFMNLTIGIFGSIAATIIIFFLGKFYNYNSKERIMYQIELALNYVHQIENHCRFPSDYEIVIHCAEKLHHCLFDIHQNIYPLSMPFRYTDKKFIRNMLYDSFRRCELAMFTTVGYDGYAEKEARLRKIENYFYDSRVNDNNISVVRIHIELIKALIEKENITQAIIECKKYCSINNYDALIEINSFTTKSYNNIIQKDGLYQHEYIQLMKNFKNSGGPDI